MFSAALLPRDNGPSSSISSLHSRAVFSCLQIGCPLTSSRHCSAKAVLAIARTSNGQSTSGQWMNFIHTRLGVSSLTAQMNWLEVHPAHGCQYEAPPLAQTISFTPKPGGTKRLGGRSRTIPIGSPPIEFQSSQLGSRSDNKKGGPLPPPACVHMVSLSMAFLKIKHYRDQIAGSAQMPGVHPDYFCPQCSTLIPSPHVVLVFLDTSRAIETRPRLNRFLTPFAWISNSKTAKS